MPLSPILEWLRPWARRGRSHDLVLAYRHAFTNRVTLLADLAVLCSAHDETYVPGDAHQTAFNEGRRAVWLHIMRMLRLKEAELRRLQEVIDDIHEPDISPNL